MPQDTTTPSVYKESLKLREGKAKLILSQPFFASILLKLRFVLDNTCLTLATDSVTLKYSDNYLDTLTNEEVKGVLCHEIMHVALGHCFRRKGRDPLLWNIAADYVVNENIMKAGGLTLPKNVLLDSTYDGKSAEAIYDILWKKAKKDSGFTKGLLSKAWAPQDIVDYTKAQQDNNSKPGNEQAQGYEDSPTDQEAKWKLNVAQAAQAAKMCGKIPANIARMVDKLLNPVLPWQEILARFVSERAHDDYSWKRPSGRYLYGGLYMPVLDSPKLGTVGVIIDTSGSISPKEVNIFAAELRSILSLCPGSKAEVVYVDSAVAGSQTLDDDDITLLPKGGGGTDFRPGFKFFKDMEDELVCYIYFTDGYCDSFPSKAPEKDTLWVLTGELPRFRPPFGEVIVMERGLDN